MPHDKSQDQRPKQDQFRGSDQHKRKITAHGGATAQRASTPATSSSRGSRGDDASEGTCAVDRSLEQPTRGIESWDLQLGRLAYSYLFDAMSTLPSFTTALIRVFALLKPVPNRVEFPPPCARNPREPVPSWYQVSQDGEERCGDNTNCVVAWTVEISQGYLRSSGVPDVIKTILVSAMETTTSSFSSAAASPSLALPLTLDEATLMHGNVSICSRVFSRVLFALESPVCPVAFKDGFESVPVVLETLITLFQRDIMSVVSPPPPLPAPTGNNAAAQAAAAAAVTMANTLAALFPFSSNKCVDMVTGLGRMIEKSDVCKRHAKTSGIMPILLQAYRVPGDVVLHQSVDKLLHVCSTIPLTPSDQREQPGDERKAVVDPQLFSSARASVPPSNDADGTQSAEAVNKPALLSVESVLSILDNNLAAIASLFDDPGKATAAAGVVFRLVRWLAFTVESPPNTQALGEAAMAILVKIVLETKPSDVMLYGFLCKCIQSIAAQSSEACELCSTDARNPVAALTGFLQSAYPPVDSKAPHRAASMASQIETIELVSVELSEQIIASEDQALEDFKLEWRSEFDEPTTFPPLPLTRERHSIDPFLYAAKTLETFASTYTRVNQAMSGNDEGSSVRTNLPDFAELLMQRLDAVGKAATTTTVSSTTKKKPNDVITRSLSGEGIVVCVLERGLQFFKLLRVFSSKNADVAVSLLVTIKTLTQLPGGVTALLSLAKTALQSQPVEFASGDGETIDTVSTSREPSSVAFPWTYQESQHTPYASLLGPILSVFETPVTCFFQLEAAAETLTALTAGNDPEPSPFQLTPGSVVEISIGDVDRLINVALSRGALVSLLAVLDTSRVARCPHTSNRRQRFVATVTMLVLRFIERGGVKQVQAMARKQELLDLHEQFTAAAVAAASKHAKADTSPGIDIATLNDQHIEFKQRWASDLLNATFGHSNTGHFHERNTTALKSVSHRSPRSSGSIVQGGRRRHPAAQQLHQQMRDTALTQEVPRTKDEQGGQHTTGRLVADPGILSQTGPGCNDRVHLADAGLKPNGTEWSDTSYFWWSRDYWSSFCANSKEREHT